MTISRASYSAIRNESSISRNSAIFKFAHPHLVDNNREQLHGGKNHAAKTIISLMYVCLGRDSIVRVNEAFFSLNSSYTLQRIKLLGATTSPYKREKRTRGVIRGRHDSRSHEQIIFRAMKQIRKTKRITCYRLFRHITIKLNAPTDERN